MTTKTEVSTDLTIQREIGAQTRLIVAKKSESGGMVPVALRCWPSSLLTMKRKWTLQLQH